MEIKVIKIEEDEYGEGGSFELFVDGKSKIYASRGEPEDMILSDRPLQATFILWALVIVAIFYGFKP